jgi:hypothetical protein
MMWMPLRAPKMKPFIFGFQRLVWWPKWTPASIISRMVMGASLGAGCWSGGRPEEDGVADSVVVSMLFLCVVFLRLRQQRPKPALQRARTVASTGVWFLMGC